MADQATLEILIQIRDEIAGLNRTRQGIKATKEEADGLGKLLREGLGIGTGMELARRGIDLVKESISELVRGAFEMATEIRRGSEALGMQGEAYQVVQVELMKAGVEMAHFSMAVTHQTDSLVQARNITSSAAEAYKTLGLSISQLEGMAPEQRAIAVANAVFGATDKTKAFQAAGQVLGSRGLPALLNGLRGLATDGYGKLSEEMKKAGLIMSDDTTKRMHDAELQIAKLKRAATITTGDMIAIADATKTSVQKNFWGTTWAILKAGIGGPAAFGDFAGTVAMNQPAPKAEAAPIVPAGPVFATSEKILAGRISDSETKAGQIQNASLLTEYERRQALMPILQQQEQLYSQLATARFGKGWELELQSLRNKAAEGKLTEEQVSKLKEMSDAEGKITDVRQKRLQAVDTPMLQLWIQLHDTAGLVEQTIAGAVNSGIASLSANIWNAMTGTAKWGDAFRSMGNIAGQALTELIVKLYIIRPLLDMFGIGASIPAGGTSAGASIAVAGGGSFVTNGPTHFTVGDNPGGAELVSVLPLSGIGRTTVNGTALRMAGGGSALVSGGQKGGGDGMTFSQTLVFNGGVSREEVMGLIPHIVAQSKAAVRDAQRRRRDGF